MIAMSSEAPKRDESMNSDLTVILPTHLEAVVHRSPSVSNLSDQALAAGGLVPVQTWMRTSTSPNAKRVKKSRERRREEGIQQLNLEVPTEIHGTLRAVAKATLEQRQRIEAILAPSPPPTEEDLVQKRRLAAVSKALPSTLARIDTVLLSESFNAKQRKMAEMRAKERRAMEQLGVSVTSLSGWRRWLVHLVVEVPDQKSDATSNGGTQK